MKKGNMLSDKAGDIMTKDVVTCKPSDFISEVRRLLVDHQISRVVVVDEENKPVGIVTQKDLVRFLSSDKSMRGIDEIEAREIMSMSLVTAKPDTSVKEIAKTMLEKRISSIVIVGDGGKLRGIVTKADLEAWYAHEEKGAYIVFDFMTKKPVTVRPSHSIFIATSLMSKHNISRLVVVDNENKPIGVITLTDATIVSDLLKPFRVVEEGKPVLVKGLLALPKTVHLLTVGDVMTVSPITINEDEDLASAARLMARHRISGLPVVNDAGRLTGIITKSDITRAVASEK
ncbi:MAG: CBS domain-containing protein [Nitrososphaeria archaeon]